MTLCFHGSVEFYYPQAMTLVNIEEGKEGELEFSGFVTCQMISL